ncbi:MAG: lytic transglycosylase domain-containing protein [Acidobacteriota bacterium]|nr:lytic transglycosylase domain-containing protein [Acidobacteriota bacterium]
MRLFYPSPVCILTAFALGLLAMLAPSPAGAELVVLTDGNFFKVQSYELKDQKMRLELATGGAVTLPLSRIERVVDDEIVPQEEAPPPPAVGLELQFADHHGVPETPYGEIIFAHGRDHGVNPELVAAVIRHESAFNPRAVSPKGARGLMQLMPATAQRFGVRTDELFTPQRNIEAGVRYLSWLVKKWGSDLPKVLASYNAGEGAVARYDGVPPYRETRNYIRRIYKTLGLSDDELAGALASHTAR